MAVLYLFPEPQTLYQCTAFFALLQFLSSCNVLWYHRGRFVVNNWTRLYSIAVAACTYYCLVYVVRTLLTDPVESERFGRMDTLLLSICGLELFMSACSYAVVVAAMQRNAHRHLQLYDRIHALDQRLQREFGANLSYHKLMRKNIIEVSALASAYLAAVCSTVVQMAPSGPWITFLGACYYVFSTSGPHLTCWLHMNFSDVLRIRFRLLQTILNPHYLRRRFPDAAMREHRLLSAMEMVKQLHAIVGDINAVYSMSLLVTLTHDFSLITSLLYLLFGHSTNGRTSYQLLTYAAAILLQPFYKMATGPSFCDMAIKEGKKCLRLIEQADVWYPESKVIKATVASLMYWRLENKIWFTCGLNIGYNRTIIASTSALVFNYLLILIQFRFTQLMGEQIEEQKNLLQDWIGDI